MRNSNYMNNGGFTLVEMAMVMVIIGLLVGGLLMPLNMQMEQRQYSQTNKVLEDAKEALIGFAMMNGRLPCPATAASNGVESFAGGGNAANGICSTFYNGFLPAVTLGILPVDSNGFLIDGFGGVPANRIRYAVWGGDNDGDGNEDMIGGITDPFTRTNGIRSAGIASIGAVTGTANRLIWVCNATPTDALPFDNCTGATILSDNAAFIIYSAGKNSTTGGVGADEIVNPNPQDIVTGNDPVFVSHTPTPQGNANGEFDDILLWVSTSTLINKMVTAGQLP